MKKPAEVSHDQAAAFQGGTLTAWHNLITRGQLLAGETVLIRSASGAVASGGVQGARHAGSRIIATTSIICTREGHSRQSTRGRCSDRL